MQKKVLLGGIIGIVVAAGVGIYHYVNYKAAAVIAEQIQVINESYAAMATEGLMPGVALSYKRIKANYWRDDYKIYDLAVNVAGLGVLLDVAAIQVKGFKPGTLADQGEVRIKGVKLAQGMQLLLPPALAELSKELTLSTHYQYDYQPQNGQLVLTQQLALGEQFTLDYQLTLQQMQPLWQFATALNAMDAEAQQSYSQSAAYSDSLSNALAQGQLQQGYLQLDNNGFLEALHSALDATEQTAALSNLKPQLEHYLHNTTELPESILVALQRFVAEPRYLKLTFQLSQPLSFAQLQDESVLTEWQTPEQLIQFTNLQLTVKP